MTCRSASLVEKFWSCWVPTEAARLRHLNLFRRCFCPIAAEFWSLIGAQGGGNQIWSTEANWILGARGAPSVNAPDIDDHTQAEWVVRANLLSFAWGSPYFLHMPFFHGNHPQLHFDALAGYAHMASWFSGSTGQRLLVLGPDVFAVVANKSGQVGAIWASAPGAVVKLTGRTALSFFDFYGNPINVSADHLQVSTSPIYFS